jgi:hypothetical protein
MSLVTLIGQNRLAAAFHLSWEDFETLSKHILALLRKNGYPAQLRRELPDKSHEYKAWSKRTLTSWFTTLGGLKGEAKFILKYSPARNEMMFDRGWNNSENEPFLSIEAQQWPFWRQLLNDLKLVQLELELFAHDVQAAPRELVNLKEIYHRIDRRTSYLSFSAEYTDPEVVFPSTVIPTYGEMTFGAMERVKHCLQELGLGEQSSLLDIGSGYGKPCFHMALETGATCHGVEFCPSRVNISNEILAWLVQERPEILGKISFEAANVFDLEGRAYDFLYWYNPLRGARVKRLLAQFQEFLQSGRIQWRLLAIYQPPVRFPGLKLVQKLPRVRTTGGQSFTLYVYEFAS